MVGFIDAHREVHGVESICAQLPIAPSTYFRHKAQHADPARRSARGSATTICERSLAASGPSISRWMARAKCGGKWDAKASAWRGAASVD
jgi:hypothetical protein